MTRPCPYCGHQLKLRKGMDYWCGRVNPERRFRFDGKQFRRVKS